METVDKIIKKCLKNNRSAQKQLYDLFSAKMYGICLRYAKNHHDAQDILQEGFMIVFSKLHTFNREGSFEGWVKRIMFNAAAQKYRDKISHLAVESMDNGIEDYKQPVEINSFKINELVEIIQKLPTQYRMVFNMYAVEGYSHKEIAEALKISENTSRSNYSRARHILREKLQDEKCHNRYSNIVINMKS